MEDRNKMKDSLKKIVRIRKRELRIDVNERELRMFVIEWNSFQSFFCKIYSFFDKLIILKNNKKGMDLFGKLWICG